MAYICVPPFGLARLPARHLGGKIAIRLVRGVCAGERSQERTNTRNGYRRREWDTRAGSISLAIPKLRQGSYFPDWLLEQRRAEAAAGAVYG